MGGSQSSSSREKEGLGNEEPEAEIEITPEGESIKISKNFLEHLAVKSGINIDEEKKNVIAEEAQQAANETTHPVSNRELEKLKFELQLERSKNEELKRVCPSNIEKTASEIESILSTRVPQLVPLCEDSRNKVADCYLSNPGRPLQCHSLVEEYKQCVRKAREVSTSTGTASDSPSS